MRAWHLLLPLCVTGLFLAASHLDEMLRAVRVFSHFADHNTLGVEWTSTGVELAGLRTKSRISTLYFPSHEEYTGWTSHSGSGNAEQRVEHEQRFDVQTGSWNVSIRAPGATARLVVHDGSAEVARHNAPHGEGRLEGGGGVLLLHLRSGTEGKPAAREHTSLRGVARPARQLAEGSDCYLEVLGVLYKFSACQSARSYLNDFTVFTSLETDSQGKGVLRMGLLAAANGGWAGFGMSHTKTMQGGEVAVLATDDRVPTGATISKFTLFSPLAERINAANGSFSLPGAVATVHPNGTLAGYFSIPTIETAANMLVEPQYFLFARGPLDAPGVLGAHFDPVIVYPYGGIDIQLSPVSGVPATRLVPAGVASPAPPAGSAVVQAALLAPEDELGNPEELETQDYSAALALHPQDQGELVTTASVTAQP